MSMPPSSMVVVPFGNIPLEIDQWPAELVHDFEAFDVNQYQLYRCGEFWIIKRNGCDNFDQDTYNVMIFDPKTHSKIKAPMGNSLGYGGMMIKTSKGTLVLVKTCLNCGSGQEPLWLLFGNDNDGRLRLLGEVGGESWRVREDVGISISGSTIIITGLNHYGDIDDSAKSCIRKIGLEVKIENTPNNSASAAGIPSAKP